MDLFKPIKKVVKRLQNYKEEKDEQQEVDDFIEKWRQQFEIDRQSKKAQDAQFDLDEEYYQGKRTFGNISEMMNNDRQIRTVVNFVRMMVESMIDLSIPEPDLRAVALDDETAVKLLSQYVSFVKRDADLTAINLENERRVKKFGTVFFKVHWNNAVKNGSYVGSIELSNPHPKLIIPNAGSIGMEDLEHYHHILNKTTKYILRRWPDITKDDLEEKAVLYKEYDEISDGTNTRPSMETNSGSDKGFNRYTIIETTYRDEDGDICKFWWSGDLLIKHIPKFYWHRDENREPTKTEILPVGTQIRIGTDPETKEPLYRTIEPQYDEEGEVILDEYGEPLGEEVEYYIPNKFDIVYQPYIPRDLCFWGTSMIEDIKDLYESFMKAFFMQEEGFLRGQKKIATDNDEDKQVIESAASEVITLKGQVREIDMRPSIDGVLWMEKMKEWMQLLTGSTNAVLGVHDPGVKSGRQAQLYVSQANYKVQLASAYKSEAYKQLYSLIADFAMAFCDDDRPFRLNGDKNNPEYASFSRLSMLRDDSGNVIYPNWDIEISAQSGWMQNKTEVLNSIVQLASQRAFEPTPGNIAYLRVLQKLGLPYLDGVIVELESEYKEQKEIQKMQMQGQAQGGQPINVDNVLAQLTPEQRQVFESLPPEQQEQLKAEIAGL